MITFKYNKQGVDVLMKKVDAVGKNFIEGAKIAMQDTLLDIQTTAKSPGYVPYITGNLKRSITHSIEAGNNKIIGKVGSNVVYAAIQEFGGTIRPKNGKYLRFKGSYGWATVKSVTIKGKFYITRAIKYNMGKFKQRLEKLILIK